MDKVTKHTKHIVSVSVSTLVRAINKYSELDIPCDGEDVEIMLVGKDGIEISWGTTKQSFVEESPYPEQSNVGAQVQKPKEWPNTLPQLDGFWYFGSCKK